MATTTIVPLNIDTLTEAHEAQPDSSHQRRAWEWLAEQSAVTFVNDALVVPSATWSDTFYHATPDTCTCPARRRCWHKRAAATIATARAEDAAYDAMAEALPFDLAQDLTTFAPSKRERSAKALADVMELFA